MKPFSKKSRLWKVGLVCLIFGVVTVVAAIVGGEDSSAVLFNRDFPSAAQIVCGAAACALGVFFMLRREEK